MTPLIATVANMWPDDLRRAGACMEAVLWAERNSHFTAEEAWLRCERADWMLWLLGKLAGPPGSDARKPLVLCACDCAETGFQYIKREATLAAAKEALRVARAWAKGEAMSLVDVRNAADAAYAAYAADAAADAYAAYAADAAADAAAAYAAAAAAYAAAAYAAAAAAYAAAYDDAAAAAYDAADDAAAAAYAAAAYAAAYDDAAAAYDADDAYDDARSRALREMAAIVRRHYPNAPLVGGAR